MAGLTHQLSGHQPPEDDEEWALVSRNGQQHTPLPVGTKSSFILGSDQDQVDIHIQVGISTPSPQKQLITSLLTGAFHFPVLIMHRLMRSIVPILQ